jgi:SAM-dependent methyltransferase
MTAPSGPQKGFKDLFGGHAADYAAARPTYPDALFDWLATLAPRTATVVDCGCGNGQASVALAGRFVRVVATDPSAEQVRNARPHPRVEYRVARAEASGLADGSIGLVTAAQAVHWFDHAAFATECRRVLVPGGAVVVWCYGVNRICPAIDAVTRRLYDELTAPFWAPERRHIDDELRSIPFPFAPLAAPAFEMALRWTLPQYLAYLRTWSACKKYEAEEGADPVALLEPEFVAAWQDPVATRAVAFPLYLRAGRV